MRDDDFVSVWIRTKPCSEQQADYILMKMSQQKKTCGKCNRCIGERCDIYTSSKEEAMVGKYLIQKQINLREDKEKNKEILLKMQGDELDVYRKEYNVMISQLKKIET